MIFNILIGNIKGEGYGRVTFQSLTHEEEVKSLDFGMLNVLFATIRTYIWAAIEPPFSDADPQWLYADPDPPNLVSADPDPWQ